MKQQPLLVMWPGVPFPLAGGKKSKTQRRRRSVRKIKKTRSKKWTN